MTWVAIAVGVGSAVVGAASSADSARKARNAQTSSGDKALDEQIRQYDLNRADQERWGMMQINGEETLYRETIARNKAAMDNGEKAGNQLAYRMGLGGTGTGEAGGLNARYKDFNFEQDPGYAFRQSQGQSGVNNKMAASGNLLSGAAMKALTRFNQDYASNEYGNSYNRYSNDRTAYEGANMNEYNRLAGIQGAGQNATNSVSGIGASATSGMNSAMQNMANGATANNNAAANAFANNQYNQGNANSAYQMAYGKALNQGLGGLTNAWNSYQTQNNGGGGGWTNSGDYWSKGGNTYGNSGGYMDQGF